MSLRVRERLALSMRTQWGSSDARRAIRTRSEALMGLLAAALLVLCAIAPVSALASSHGTQYTLEVTEGENTIPQYESVAQTVATVNPSAQVAVSIVRNGTTVYKSEGDGWAGVPQVPQPGETVVLESPVGHVVGSDVYDGLPTIDPSTCVGYTNFEGENTAGFTVEGSFITDTLLSARKHEVKRSGFNQAQVKTLTGTSFGGNFLAPINAGATVMVSESLKTALAGEATYTYISERVEPANAKCPAPPPAAAPPPPLVTPLHGALVVLGHSKIKLVLKSGYRDGVSINQAGTVTQDLYLRGGRLPATAAAHHKKTPPAVLLARGVARAGAAGNVSVVLKLTAAGRRKLKSARSVSAILLTTLRTANGQVATLAPKSLTLHR
jgi:hypothetical protein